MTLLVALALATAVKLRPVLASRVTSGKKRLTVLIGTTTLRGRTELDAFAELLAGDGDCPFAISKSDSITTVNTAANLVSVGPFRMSVILRWPVDGLPQHLQDHG
jgi:predicted secreted protein